jgi:hypothetical protein
MNKMIRKGTALFQQLVIDSGRYCLSSTFYLKETVLDKPEMTAFQ